MFLWQLALEQEKGDVSGPVVCSHQLTFQFLEYVHRVPHLQTQLLLAAGIIIVDC